MTPSLPKALDVLDDAHGVPGEKQLFVGRDDEDLDAAAFLGDSYGLAADGLSNVHEKHISTMPIKMINLKGEF